MPVTLDPLEVSVGEPTRAIPPASGTVRLHAFAAFEWLLVEARYRSGLGELDDAEIEVAVRDELVDYPTLLGTRVTLEAERGDLRRVFHALIVGVDDLGTRMDPESSTLQTVLRLHAAPEMWLLSQRKTSRVFHHATALAVVRDVLKDAGVYQSGNFDVRVGKLDGTSIRAREYCVQYQETDLDFVRRLLEEEGLTMLFRHDAALQAETLCIVDGAQPRDDVYRRLDNGDGHDEVDLVAAAHQQSLHPHQSFVQFGAACRVRPASVALSDFDLSNSRARSTMNVSQTGPGPATPAPLAVYEHPGRYVFDPLDRPESEATAATGQQVYPAAPRSHETGARRRLEVRHTSLRGDQRLAAAKGNVLGLEPGMLFRLRNHPSGDYDREYLVTTITHVLRNPQRSLDGAAGSGDATQGYTNEITALASDVVFRPARVTAKPTIAGIQTALVVGDPGRELHTDYYGRIKVQLHWDRAHHAETNAEAPVGQAPADGADPAHLCWVRVAQTWAGAGWGTMFVPRVGMEVVVAFLDGDPDRPLVVGAVYNDANPPPYPLPASASRSTIRTKSTPVGSGEDRYNELRFEDATHNEEIHLRAQRDLDEWVGRNRTTQIAEQHTVRVGADEDVAVRGNQHVGVTLSQRLEVGMDQRVIVKGDRTVAVERNEHETIVGRSERVRGEDVLTVIGDRITTIYGSDVVMSRGPTQTTIAPHDPAVGEPGDDKQHVEHLESRTVRGSRKQRVDELDDYYAHSVVSLIEDSEKRTIGKAYRVNVGEEANLLVTGLKDPDDDTVGYFVDAKAVRIGSHAKSVEEVMMFRGRDILHIGNDQITAQADDKPFEIRIGRTGCSIKLSADGKKIEVVALDEIVLRSEEHKSSITIGKSIAIDAGPGEITLSGSKISGG